MRANKAGRHQPLNGRGARAFDNLVVLLRQKMAFGAVQLEEAERPSV